MNKASRQGAGLTRTRSRHGQLDDRRSLGSTRLCRIKTSHCPLWPGPDLIIATCKRCILAMLECDGPPFRERRRRAPPCRVLSFHLCEQPVGLARRARQLWQVLLRDVVPRDIDHWLPFAARQPSVPCLCSLPPAVTQASHSANVTRICPPRTAARSSACSAGLRYPARLPRRSRGRRRDQKTLGNLSMLGESSGAARQVQKPCSPWSPTRSKLIAWPSAEAPEPCRFL